MLAKSLTSLSRPGRAQGEVAGRNPCGRPAKCLPSRGYEAVTLREIAKEIGYTHAVIYQHFPDHWHILVELSSETIGLMVQDTTAAIFARHLSAAKIDLFATSRGFNSILH